MSTPTTKQMIEELLGLPEYDYAMAVHEHDYPVSPTDILSAHTANELYGLPEELRDLSPEGLEATIYSALPIGNSIAGDVMESGLSDHVKERIAAERQQFRDLVRAREAREQELQQMSASTIAKIYKKAMALNERRLEEERLADEERRRASEEEQRLEEEQQRLAEEERQRFYNLEDSFADLDQFAKMPCWTKEEAVALSLGRDPGIVTWDVIREYEDRSEFVREYHYRMELLDRAQKIGKFAECFSPGQFITWARHYKITLPDGLTEAVSQYDEEAIDWRSKYEELKRTSADRETSAPRHPRQERSDAIIILGIAMDKFHFKPDKRNSAAQRIADCCFREGLKISEDTVRDRLMNANRAAKKQHEDIDSLS